MPPGGPAPAVLRAPGLALTLPPPGRKQIPASLHRDRDRSVRQRAGGGTGRPLCHPLAVWPLQEGKQAGPLGSARPSGPTITSDSPHRVRLLSISQHRVLRDTGTEHTNAPTLPESTPSGSCGDHGGAGRQDTGSPDGRWRGGDITPTRSFCLLLSHTPHPASHDRPFALLAASS